MVFLKLHIHYLQGNLAVVGGILDQPAVYLEAMEFISGRIGYIKSERARVKNANRLPQQNNTDGEV